MRRPRLASPLRRRRFLTEWLTVGAIATALVAAVVFTDAARRLDHTIYDAAARLAPPAPDDGIVLVTIDDASLAALGRWPWPREHHTALLRRLAQARPAAILYDVLFVEPAADPATDRALGEALRAAAPVFLPVLVETPGRDGAGFTVVEPVAPLASAAAGLGHVNLTFDDDGVVRSVFLFEGDAARPIAHLVVAAVRHLQPSAARPTPRLRAGPGLVQADPVMIPYAGRAGAYRTVPFASVMRGETPPEVFRGRIVLVGGAASGLFDRYATPMGDAGGMPGVEIQANLLQTLTGGRPVTPLSRGGVLAAALAVVAVLLVGFLRLSPRRTLLLAACLGLAALAGSVLLLTAGRIWAPPGAAILGLLVAYPLWSWRRLEAASGYMVEELERFRRDGDVLSSPAPATPTGDVVERQLELMDYAVARTRDLRRFAAETLHGLPDATLVLDGQGRVLLANALAAALFADKDVVGLHWLQVVAGWKAIGDTTAPPPDAWLNPDLSEIVVRSPDSRVHRIRTVLGAGESPDASRLVVRLSDITAAHAANEQRERVQQLLTHDMRSPQVSILALLEGPAGETASPDLARQISGYARRTLALADDFIHLARAQADNYDLEPLDLSDVLVDAADELWPQAQARGVAIEAPAAEVETIVTGDRTLLTRALINLIDNAVKYSAPGGVVTCLAERRDDRAVCVVADRGRGMSAEQLARLDEPFQRFDGTRDRRTDGAGLGLAMVRAVAARHGGKIAFESRPGVGTTVTLTLPSPAGAP